jgi:hypothetical protein
MTSSEFLRAQHYEIIATWGERSLVLAHARRLPGLVLLSRMPDLLEALANRLEGAPPLVVQATALELAVDRCRYGIPLHEVVSEYSILRDVIENKAQQCGHVLPATFERAFADAVDETIELYKRAGDESVKRAQDDGQRS